MAAVSLDHALRLIIEQTYSEVLPAKFRCDEASVMLLAIGGQESEFETRQQVGGPARSFWQFERGGGIRGVLTCEATKSYARAVCQSRGIMPTVDSVYARMLDDDLLGCAFARLLLYSDPAPLPRIGQQAASWDYYENIWRPGHPRPEKWARNYANALATLKGAA